MTGNNDNEYRTAFQRKKATESLPGKMCGETAHLLCQFGWIHLVGIYQSEDINLQGNITQGPQSVNPTLSLNCADLPEWFAKTLHHKQQNHLSQFLASSPSWGCSHLDPSMLQNVELTKSGVFIPLSTVTSLGASEEVMLALKRNWR